MPEDIPVTRTSEYTPRDWNAIWRNESKLENTVQGAQNINSDGIPVTLHRTRIDYGRVPNPPNDGTAAYMIDLPRIKEGGESWGDGRPPIVDINPWVFSPLITGLLAGYLWWRAHKKPYNTVEPDECTHRQQIKSINGTQEGTP